jgi:hypothetical protein
MILALPILYVVLDKVIFIVRTMDFMAVVKVRNINLDSKATSLQ